MKTAVETLFEKLELLRIKLDNKKIDTDKYNSQVKKIYEDCLLKEMNSIKCAFDAGYYCDGYEVSINGDSSDIYYNKTFKTNIYK
jgi:hypothetical protein